MRRRVLRDTANRQYVVPRTEPAPPRSHDSRISLRIPPICALSAERAGFSLLRPAGSSFLLLEVLAFHFRSPVNYRSFGFGGYAFSHIGGPEVIPAFPLRYPLSRSGLWGCPNRVRFSRTSPLRIHQQEKERSTPHVCGSDRDSELLPTRQYSFARPRSFLLAPDTYAVRVTGDFKAAPGLTTARNGLSAFGGFARLRLTHLPLSGESPTIHQQGRQLARGD